MIRLRCWMINVIDHLSSTWCNYAKTYIIYEITLMMIYIVSTTMFLTIGNISSTWWRNVCSNYNLRQALKVYPRYIFVIWRVGMSITRPKYDFFSRFQVCQNIIVIIRNFCRNCRYESFRGCSTEHSTSFRKDSAGTQLSRMNNKARSDRAPSNNKIQLIL